MNYTPRDVCGRIDKRVSRDTNQHHRMPTISVRFEGAFLTFRQSVTEPRESGGYGDLWVLCQRATDRRNAPKDCLANSRTQGLLVYPRSAMYQLVVRASFWVPALSD